MSRLERPRARGAVPGPLRFALVVFFLYLFLVGVALLEAGISSMGAGLQASLLRQVSNPISGLSVGVLTTILVQSSSVTTSAIVGMVGSGTLPLALAIPMVMGANIGTTVTSTLASLGSIRRADEFRRAFAAATVHDFFNVCAVLVLLPLEMATGVLRTVATQLTELLRDSTTSSESAAQSPVKLAVQVPAERLESMLQSLPAHGIILLAVGLGLIFLALAMITRNMRRLVAGEVERVMNRLIGSGGGAIGILVGIGVTVAVQSSSITTSILVPLVASGILSLRSAFPITVGANIGTTITALLASLAVVLPEGLTIALVHCLFNIAATMIIFPLPQTRSIPIRFAEGLAALAVRRPSAVAVYVLGAFVLLPLLGVFLIR